MHIDVFDEWRNDVSIAWVIISWPTKEDFVSCLGPLCAWMFHAQLKWIPSRFVIEDAPQECLALKYVSCLLKPF